MGIHLESIKANIIRDSSQREQTQTIFKKMYLPFRVKTIREELEKSGANLDLTNRYFKWLSVYRILLATLIVSLIALESI